MNSDDASLAPWGESFPLPTADDDRAEMDRLRKLVDENREAGRQIVVVVGLGFVGSVMAAVVADAMDGRGRPAKFVIGLDRRLPATFWKIPVLNRGDSPVSADDPEVAPLIRRCAVEKKTLTATWALDALSLADVVVVDIQCDYVKETLGNVRKGTVDMLALEDVFEKIGAKVDPGTLVLIETTVAPGTTEQVALPIIKKAFEKRGIAEEPLLAHSYERVMPGKDYVASVRDYWRVCSGVNAKARDGVTRFLKSVLNTEKYPLTVLDRPIESETAKIIENSYRATILAFMDEWSMFAERNGIDMKRVIEAIRMRPTHSNILFPGPGIGGYCLPKDGGLGIWSYRHILGWEDDIFRVTPLAIDINDGRALHVPQMVRDALRNMGESISSADVLVLGVSYREDVGDTRYSGSELIVRRLSEMGAALRVHDPYVERWPELEYQDSYPAGDHSKARFFDRQSRLSELRLEKDMWAAMKGVKAIVMAVRHSQYLEMDPDEVLKAVGKPFAMIDCFLVLDDKKIRRYLELGCEVKGLGRGHIKRIKESIRKGC
jgi:UDP-N-acetyl-D-glucosamine dehydrogenase